MDPFKEKFLYLYKRFPELIDGFTLFYQDGELNMTILRLTIPTNQIKDDMLNDIIRCARIQKEPVAFENPVIQKLAYNPKLSVSGVSLWRDKICYVESKHYVEYIHLEVRRSWWLRIFEWIDNKIS